MSKCHGCIHNLPSLADHQCVNGIDDWERYVNVQIDNLFNLYTGDDLMDDVSKVFNDKRTLYYSSCMHRVSKPDHGILFNAEKSFNIPNVLPNMHTFQDYMYSIYLTFSFNNIT